MSEHAVLLGNGGREHALAATMHRADKLYVLPGNAGTEELTYVENIVDVPPNDPGAVALFALQKQASLVVSGPEAPLVAGVGDRVRAEGLSFFGPNAEGARLEASKAHATDFMTKYDIPHPRTEVAHTFADVQDAIRRAFADKHGYRDEIPPFVIKKDGLHGGKGVTVPENDHELTEALLDAMPDGKSGEPILLQEKLHGPEVSMFVLVDSTGRHQVLPFSQDHKRVGEGDTGKNTGGMGAYAPVPESILSPKQVEQLHVIAAKTAHGLQQEEGIDYRGVIYVGTILAEEYGGDPLVIEYNVRFGDPEAQAILPLLAQNGADIYGMLRSTAEGHLDEGTLAQSVGGAALTICLAAPNYPDGSSEGQYIFTGTGMAAHNAMLYYGGVIRQGNRLVTNGGRLVYATGTGPDLRKARENAAAAAGHIRLVDPTNGKHTIPLQRRDIGHQAITN